MSTTPNLGDVVNPAETVGRRRPIIVHRKIVDQRDVHNWPEFNFAVGRAMCGFVFTTRNRVTMMERVAEGEERCAKCDAISLELMALCS